MSSDPERSSPEPKTILVFSQKPPDEVKIFDLRGSDIQDIRVPTKEEPPVSPDEWGITSTNEDGVCKYCQLMLHPDAPEITVHQPNVQTLIDSTCRICGWVEVSLVKGAPQIAARYHQGDPSLCDPNSTSAGITIAVSRHSNYTTLVPVVGPRHPFNQSGIPLNTSTPSRLGDLASRRFWEPYDESANSPPHERLNMLKNWLGECYNHEDCWSSLPANRDTVLPTRVLDLTGSPNVPSKLEDIKVKLRETSLEEMGSYVALSYCWGADPEYHYVTTTETLEQHKDGIDYGRLPLTQREAILASLYLGIRYLWIDSLCIIQDSAQDWQVEAAKMSTVYSNSHLTLAATSSSSPKDGLLNPFQAAVCANLHGETVMVRMETHKTIEKASEPLNTRAWTLQETFLSPRLVCFGGEQWLWKCPSRYATEDGLIDRPQLRNESMNQWAGIVREGSGDDGRNYFRHWSRLVWNYSKRVLTYEEDKLKAIAGLADIFAKETGYQYIAGLWAEDIARGLMWGATSAGVIRHAGNIPSWSWASVKGEVLTPDLPKGSTNLIKLLNVEQHWEGVPLSSPLKFCRLTVSGMMIQLNIGKRSLTQKLRHHLIPAPESEEIAGEAFLDNTSPIEQGISTVWCLRVASEPSSSGELEHFVLMLTPAMHDDEEDNVDKYKRIGFGIIWEKSRFSDGQRDGKDTFVEGSDAEIVLV